MSHSLWQSFSICIIALSVILSADNSKLIETALQDYVETKTKADDLHTKAVDRARNETVSKLAKLAARAYTEKDRLAETNAWKAILRIDPMHPKASQYFKDLGSLDEVLKEVSLDDRSSHAKALARFAGKWKATYSNGASEEIEFDKSGAYRVTAIPGLQCVVELKLSESAINVTYPGGDHMNRYTLAGDRLLVEQWGPPTGFPKDPPTFFGRAVRVE